MGRFILQNPNTTFENNTFLYVAATNSLMNSVAPHPLKFEAVDVRGAIVRNNIFVGCGQGRDSEQIGWYDFDNRPADALVSHNFVAGPPVLFSEKAGFTEGFPALNGGDPGFVDITDPLGPDGIPFTPDDGLRLKPGSKLRGAGFGGADLGAYTTEGSSPSVGSLLLPNGKIRLTWDASQEFLLQSASRITGEWSTFSGTIDTLEGRFVLDLDATNSATFFRLQRN